LIYNLKTMNDIQTQQLFANWCFLLNHPNVYSLPISSQIIQLQYAASTNQSILTSNSTVFSTPEINTATAQSIILFNSLQISTTVPLYLNQNIILIARYSINYILQNLLHAASFKAKLNNTKIW